MWCYADNTARGEFGVNVPLPRDKEAPIAHKNIDHAEKTLGALISPDGNSVASIQLMQEKAQSLINAVRGGHLHRWNMWFSLKVQFWPRVGYGLCSTTATYCKLEQALHWQYYQILPLGGVVRHTTVASRTMNSGFYGVGHPNIGVEATIAMINKLLMHFGCGREVHADIIFTTPRGAWPVVPTAAGGLRQIQPSSHTHMDEDAVGKGVYVWYNSDHPVGIGRFPERRGRIHNANDPASWIQLRQSQAHQQSASIHASTLPVQHTHSIRKYNRTGNSIPKAKR
jgi:hypothetical protein